MIHLILKNASFLQKKGDEVIDRKKYDQNEYNKRWIEKNREKKKYLSYRSTARTFINHYAKLEDLKELEELFEKKY